MIPDVLRHLLALTLVSSAVSAVVLLIRRPVRRAFGASVSYRAWLLVPIAMAAMLLPAAPHPGSDVMQMDPMYALVDRSMNLPHDAHASINWPSWLFGAWATGAGIFCAYFAGLQRTYVKGLGQLSESRGTLRAASSAGCPALLGVLWPRVVLPDDFESRYTPQEQALVLAHESVHLQRRDTLWNALLVLLRCVFWFNPLIHVAARFVRVDQELACDAAVIERHPASKRTYADAMLKTELADAALPVGCHWRSSHPFKERLEMLKTNMPSRARRAVGGGLFAVVSVVVGYAAWAADPAPAQTPAEPSAQIERAPHTKGLLNLGPNAQVQTFANMVSNGPNGAQVLEGDVRIEVMPPPGKHHMVMIRKTPEGVQRTESAQEPRPFTVKAQKVTLTPMEDGGVTLQFDNGTIEQH